MSGAGSGHEVGEVRLEGEHATLVFRRELPCTPAVVWKMLTDPTELAGWYMTRAVIDGRAGGSVDFHAGMSHFHVTGKILTWDPPRVFEHEWKVAPRPELPAGEDAVIRWELRPSGPGTSLLLEHRHLSRRTATGFAPGTHAFLDRLMARVRGVPPPDWRERYSANAPNYPGAWRLQ